MSPSKKIRNKALTVAASPDAPMIPNEIVQDKQLAKRIAYFRDLILQRHEQCVGAGIKLVERFVCCGEPLAHARIHLGQRGVFENWIADNFSRETGLGLRTAQRYMRAYKGFLEFLEDRNAAPPPGSLSIVTTNKELLLAYCKHVIALREAEKQSKRKSSPRPLSEAVLEALRAFFGDNQFDEIHLHETMRADFEQIFVDARTMEGDLQAHIDTLLFDVANGNVTEALLLLPFKTALQYESLWQFPIVVIRENSTPDRMKSAQKSKLPIGCLIIYVSNHPDFERFATLRDIGVAFAPLAIANDSSRTLTLPR